MKTALTTLFVCLLIVSAFAQDKPDRKEIMIRTLINERDGWQGESQLCNMNIAELRDQLASTQKELAELKQKNTPTVPKTP